MRRENFTNLLGTYRDGRIFDGTADAPTAKHFCPDGLRPVYAILKHQFYYTLNTCYMDNEGNLKSILNVYHMKATVMEIELPAEPAPIEVVRRLFCRDCHRRGTRVINTYRYCSDHYKNHLTGLKKRFAKKQAYQHSIHTRVQEVNKVFKKRDGFRKIKQGFK